MTATFAAVFVLLHLGHTFADFLSQTDFMAMTKLRADRLGLCATLWHGLHQLFAQAAWLTLGGILLRLELTVAGFLAAIVFNVGTHVLIDWNKRGSRLWCYLTGSRRFYDESEPDGDRQRHTHGSLHVDQALHQQLTGGAALLAALL
jgi:hypothetical protein